MDVAAELRALLAESEIERSHQGPECDKVQDPYSLRCAPQVHGAAHDGLRFVREVLSIEAQRGDGQPLVFAEGHGQPDVTGELVVSGGTSTGSRSRRRWTCSPSLAPSSRRSASAG